MVAILVYGHFGLVNGCFGCSLTVIGALETPR